MKSDTRVIIEECIRVKYKELISGLENTQNFFWHSTKGLWSCWTVLLDSILEDNFFCPDETYGDLFLSELVVSSV